MPNFGILDTLNIALFRADTGLAISHFCVTYLCLAWQLIHTKKLQGCCIRDLKGRSEVCLPLVDVLGKLIYQEGLLQGPFVQDTSWLARSVRYLCLILQCAQAAMWRVQAHLPAKKTNRLIQTNQIACKFQIAWRFQQSSCGDLLCRCQNMIGIWLHE